MSTSATAIRSYRQLLTLTAIAFLIFQQLVLVPPPSVYAVSPNLVVSQVYGGGGNSGATFTHDFIEIYNRGAVAASLNGMSLQYTSATGTGNFGANSGQLTELPNILVQPGQTILVQEASNAAVGAPLPAPDVTDATPINMSGTAGKVALVTGITTLGCNGGSTACNAAALARIVDLVGYGNANFFEGAPVPTLSNTTAAIRKAGGATDTDNNLADFTVAVPAPRMPETAPSVASTAPANIDTGVFPNSNLAVVFSEPVTVSASSFSISCGTSGSHSVVVTGGPTAYTVDPNTDFAANESCTVTVVANQVSDTDINDPPDFMAANYVWSFSTSGDPCTSPFTNIFTVQGSGNSSPSLNGTDFTIRGIVTGDFQGAIAFDGFHLQDPVGDFNVLTSDGIFVFAPGSIDVVVGDDAVVRGKVTEFNGMTEITNVTGVAKCGIGSITPTTVDLPETVEGDLERYEGMLVTIPEALTVTETFNLGRFGEALLSADGRLFQPTNSNPPSSVPGSPTQLAIDENNRRKIVLDDGKSIQNPNPIPFLGPDNTIRLGDAVAGLTGVVEFRFSEYRIQATVAPVFTYVNTRPTTHDPVGGNVKVASSNVLNYFNGNGTGLDGAAGGFPTSRGADNLNEFNRQRAKIIAALTSISADVLGVIEIENDGGGATSAIQDLVNGLNAATAPGTYSFRLGTTPGTDLIMNAIIFKPASVTPIGAAFNDPDPIWAGQARNPLAQTFQYNANGETFTFIVNHFTSKSCSPSDTGLDADQGDGQGCDNLQRTLQAQRLLLFVADRQAASGDPDVLVMGDLNAYGKEDPINVLTSGGLVNEIEAHIANPYSFVFGGLSGYLDHALTTASMSDQVTGVTEWHINADEPPVIDYNTEFKTQDLYTATPYRSADHDPVIVGLDLNAPPVIQTLTAAPNPALVNGSVAFSATFTDADLADTHTASWDWGDGSSSSGTVSSGSVNDSHTYTAVGTYTVTLTVTDSNGNTDTQTLQVEVTYGINVLYDETKAHKSGSTIPIRLQLVDANGNNLSSADTTVHFVAVKQHSDVVSGTDYDAGDANPDNDFRFDPTLGGYVFNLSTKSLNLEPGEYTLCFSVEDDPVIHSVTFRVR